MRVFQITALLTTLTATFAYINYRFLKLEPTVGLLLQSLLLSLLLWLLLALAIDVMTPAQRIMSRIDFDVLFLQGILSLLLFTGGLFVKVEELLNVKLSIALFAVAGVLVSAGAIGAAFYAITLLLGLKVGLAQSLLFGAIMSPTDPVAVLPTLYLSPLLSLCSALTAGTVLRAAGGIFFGLGHPEAFSKFGTRHRGRGIGDRSLPRPDTSDHAAPLLPPGGDAAAVAAGRPRSGGSFRRQCELSRAGTARAANANTSTGTADKAGTRCPPGHHGNGAGHRRTIPRPRALRGRHREQVKWLLRGPVGLLRHIHSGYIGDYVTWFICGTSVMMVLAQYWF
ncbi:cation:proton antiporter domain-containing protein [Geomonas propionica]|uniref:Cation:proton antiporter n=1 Tax=Geomonas propionica TaxID=2798582 RepID=A0ABS0YTQ5_9BACT|nr:cation:proton antiporter [Geomonas propionica]MBJ6801359.1 cation:proton antiporter [Geomonas propionica]